MNYLLLLITTVGVSAQTICNKQYNKKAPKTPIIYSAMTAVSALLFFILSSGFKFYFNIETFKFSVIFALAYVATLISMTIAIGCGPLSISALINSYSLIIPTLYGIIFLSEPVKPYTLIGIIMLAFSLFAVNYVKKNKNSTVISLKWFIAISVSFIGNGMCSTIQKQQQISLAGKNKSEFMIMALILSATALFVSSYFLEKKENKAAVKKFWYLPFFCGIFNGIVNLLVMVLGNKIPISVLFPVISAGGIIITSILAITYYKEKLSKIQLFGVLIGIISIVFLNL